MDAKEKLERRVARDLEKAKCYRLSTYLRSHVATALQGAIVYEAGAFIGDVRVMRDGTLTTVRTEMGQVACVTCGKPGRANDKGMQGGHFLASKRASFILDERGIHVQCFTCNSPRGGNHEQYEQWMQHTMGQEVIDDLHRLKNQVTKKWDLEELVYLRIGYLARKNAAKKLIDTHTKRNKQ